MATRAFTMNSKDTSSCLKKPVRKDHHLLLRRAKNRLPLDFRLSLYCDVMLALQVLQVLGQSDGNEGIVLENGVQLVQRRFHFAQCAMHEPRKEEKNTRSSESKAQTRWHRRNRISTRSHASANNRTAPPFSANRRSIMSVFFQ